MLGQRNILEQVRKSDYDEVKRGAQAIYRVESRRQAEAAFRAFRQRWQREYGPMVRRLERDLPELLSFSSFPQHLWKMLRTTNLIERCFVEVRPSYLHKPRDIPCIAGRLPRCAGLLILLGVCRHHWRTL